MSCKDIVLLLFAKNRKVDEVIILAHFSYRSLIPDIKNIHKNMLEFHLWPAQSLPVDERFGASIVHVLPRRFRERGWQVEGIVLSQLPSCRETRPSPDVGRSS